jgi:phospholipase/lecithinase/hemolysin
MNLRTVALTLGTALWALSAQARLFDDIFVFGDSLSDGGNSYALTGGFPPYVDPSFTATQRATNGPTAAEVMATRLGTPVTPSRSGGTNYSVMGAATRPYVRTDLADPPAGFPPPPLPAPIKPASLTTSNYVPFGYWYLNDYHYFGLAGFEIDNLEPYGVDKQVDDFLDGPPVQDPSRSLFMIWTGVNDFLLGDAGGFLGAAGNIAAFVGALYDDPNVAARYFLVPNIPDLAKTPDSLAEFAMLPPDEAAIQAAQLRGLTQLFNETLTGNLDAVEASRPGLTVVEFDTFSFVDAILADAGAYGFTNATQACVDRNNPAIVCANPDEYVFWDGFHPSAASHALIGEAFAGAITQAIPEPGTYALMAAGLILLVMVRRRASAH